MRKFNVTGLCVPAKHYMVDITLKLDKIVELIDTECYFTINRARQYGKTTTLSQLQKRLAKNYICARISFEGIGDESFETPEAFCAMLLRQISKSLEFSSADTPYAKEWPKSNISSFEQLGDHISNMCSYKKVVLLVDEVDKISNNRIFIQFLGMLRAKYLLRQEGMDSTFHSVVLAGVSDIKNIKLKMVNDGVYAPYSTEGKIYNSPWNIATNFDIDMSFNPTEIATMLSSYEAEHKTGMNIMPLAEEIYKYTGGYPFLVSRICLCIDETLEKDWTESGIQEAVKIILHESNTLFDDLSKNLENYKNLYEFLYTLLIVGERKIFMLYDSDIMLASMFGYIKSDKASRRAVISNKIFEILMSNYFASKDSNALRIEKRITGILHQDIVKNNVFDMELCLRKFAQHYREIFTESDIPFLERHGRLLFISYLKPLINGQGFYHIESQFTDLRRMDIVVDFGRDQFIIELKLWRGESSKEKAYEQLLSYMDSKNANCGYLLTFDFRKDVNKEYKCEWVYFHDKRVFDVIV